MDPNLRRYLPALVVLALVGVAVYMGQPDTLTGSAAGSGCAGATGQLPDAIVEVGTEADEGASEAVRTLVLIDVNDANKAGQVAALEEARQQVSEFGAAAVPAILDELQSSGCNEAASADLMDLLGDLGGMNQFAGQAQMKMALMLLDIAITAVDSEEAERQFRDPNSVTDQEEADRVRCAEEAGVVITNWYASTRGEDQAADDNSQALAMDVMGRLKDLPAGDFRAVKLIQILDQLADLSERWAATFEGMTIEDLLHAGARGVACQAAVRRKSDLSAVLARFKEIEEAPVLVCAIKVASQSGNTNPALYSLVSEDVRVREAAIRSLGSVGGPEFLGKLTEMLFDTDVVNLETPEARDEEKREQVALVAAIGQIIARDDEGDLEVTLADIAAASENVSNGETLVEQITAIITRLGGGSAQGEANGEEEGAEGEGAEGEGAEEEASPDVEAEEPKSEDGGGSEGVEANQNSEEEDAAEGAAEGDNP